MKGGDVNSADQGTSKQQQKVDAAGFLFTAEVSSTGNNQELLDKKATTHDNTTMIPTDPNNRENAQPETGSGSNA